MDQPQAWYPRPPPLCRFGGFTLDTARGILCRPDDTEIALRPKTAEVLRFLAGKAGDVVSREDLLAAVWPGIFITDDSVTQCVVEIRRALGQWVSVLRTLPRRGYLLDDRAAHTELPQHKAVTVEAAAARPAAAGTRAGHRRSALAVLPFYNLSGDPHDDYFAQGIMEELTIALSRIRWFSVVGRTSTLRYKGQAVDARRIGRELGVRYLLEGSVHKAAARVRIACRLINAETGHQIWAERFEGGLKNIFGLQDRVAEAVTGAVEPGLERAEMERARRRPIANLTAYDLYLRSLAPFSQ